MITEHVHLFIKSLNLFIWSWPLLLFVIFSGIIVTWKLKAIQIRYFFKAWKFIWIQESGTESKITTMQAFLNTLNGSIGNGSLIGMATAIYSGGPGAAFWVLCLGFFTMPLRCLEVYAATTTVWMNGLNKYYGPIAYIRNTPGGSILVYMYVFFCLILSLFSGNAMQCQAIVRSTAQTFSIFLFPIGVISVLVSLTLFLFIMYVTVGGNQRILKIADMIIPIKVGSFFIATLIALVACHGMLLQGLSIIIEYAFCMNAVKGACIGYSLQNSIRFGIARVLNATEIGLGTSGLLFGGTMTQNPVRSSIMAMTTAFITNYLVCFPLMLLIVATGAWNSHLLGADMTILAYAATFGSWAPLLISFLSILFGFGVLITYAYIGKECWTFLVGEQYVYSFIVLYSGMALVGGLSDVALIWDSIDIAVAGLVLINLYSLLYHLSAMTLTFNDAVTHEKY